MQVGAVRPWVPRSSDKAFQHHTDVKKMKPEVLGHGSWERISKAPTRAPHRDAVSNVAEQQQEQHQKMPDKSLKLPVPSCFQGFSAEENSGTVETPLCCTQAGWTRKNQLSPQEGNPSWPARQAASKPPRSAAGPGGGKRCFAKQWEEKEGVGRAFLHLSNHLPIAQLPSCICADPCSAGALFVLEPPEAQEENKAPCLLLFHLSALLRQYPVCAADFGILLLIFPKFPLREPAEL